MRSYLTTLPAALALTGALWFAAAPAFADDCWYIEVCILGHCVSVEICKI